MHLSYGSGTSLQAFVTSAALGKSNNFFCLAFISFLRIWNCHMLGLDRKVYSDRCTLSQLGSSKFLTTSHNPLFGQKDNFA